MVRRCSELSEAIATTLYHPQRVVEIVPDNKALVSSSSTCTRLRSSSRWSRDDNPAMIAQEIVQELGHVMVRAGLGGRALRRGS